MSILYTPKSLLLTSPLYCIVLYAQAMDPLSVAATVAGLTKVSYETTHILYGFTDKILNVDDHLYAFASEVANTSRILNAVTTTLNDPHLRLSQISSSPKSNKDV